MKKLITLLFVLLQSASLFPQRNKTPKMAAVFVAGYYVNFKGDTVLGQVQINPDDETEFYRKFSFITGKSRHAKEMTTNRIKGYGFENRNFVVIENSLFAERLTNGRLRFYEYKYNGKIDGAQAIESAFYVRDAGADGKDAKLNEPYRISTKFYKKALKPYMKEQPMIWTDLDKYTFNKDAVVSAIHEFNQFYSPGTQQKN